MFTVVAEEIILNSVLTKIGGKEETSQTLVY